MPRTSSTSLAALGLALAPTLALTACGSGGAPESQPTAATESFTMPSTAMVPTFSDGARFTASPTSDYEGKRGDIVVFRVPHGWDAQGGDRYLVERVIGVGGDTVTCCDLQGRLEIDGDALDEGYLAPRSTTTSTPDPAGTLTVCDGPEAGSCDWTSGEIPDGDLFVMGDNRADSLDSSSHLCAADAPQCPASFVSERLVYAVTE